MIDEVYDISSSDLVFRIAGFMGFLWSISAGAAITAGPVALALFVPLIFIAIIVSPFYYSRRRRKGLQTVDVNLGSVSSILIDTENERFAFRVGGTDLTWRSFAVTEDFASAVTYLKQIHGPQISGGTITGGNKVPVIIMLVLVGAMIIGLSIAAINIFWPFLLR